MGLHFAPLIRLRVAPGNGSNYTTGMDRATHKEATGQGRQWIAAALNPDADVYRVRKLTASAAHRAFVIGTATRSTIGAWTCESYIAADDDAFRVVHASKSATQQLWFVIEPISA